MAMSARKHLHQHRFATASTKEEEEKKTRNETKKNIYYKDVHYFVHRARFIVRFIFLLLIKLASLAVYQFYIS